MMDQLPLEPRARHSDPDTAHEAAAKAKHGSEAMNAAILAAVASPHWSSGYSAFEIAERVMRAHPDRWNEDSVRTAVSRLGKKGKLRKYGTTLSPRGQRCTVWTKA